MIYLRVDEKLLDNVWGVIQNKTIRNILRYIGSDSGYNYTALLNFINPHKKTSNGRTAYYLRKMLDAKIVKIDESTKKYILTRIGVQSLQVIKDFENICSRFDLSDCDADGKIIKIETVVTIKR